MVDGGRGYGIYVGVKVGGSVKGLMEDDVGRGMGSGE
jgi:hypothetical protein